MLIRSPHVRFSFFPYFIDSSKTNSTSPGPSKPSSPASPSSVKSPRSKAPQAVSKIASLWKAPSPSHNRTSHIRASAANKPQSLARQTKSLSKKSCSSRGSAAALAPVADRMSEASESCGDNNAPPLSQREPVYGAESESDSNETKTSETKTDKHAKSLNQTRCNIQNTVTPNILPADQANISDAVRVEAGEGETGQRASGSSSEMTDAAEKSIFIDPSQLAAPTSNTVQHIKPDFPSLPPPTSPATSNDDKNSNPPTALTKTEMLLQRRDEILRAKKQRTRTTDV